MAAVEKYDVTGIGFVFTDDDPFSGIDLDNCRDPKAGILTDWAQEVIRSLDSYTEVSPSSTGVKIWVRGNLPAGSRNQKAYHTGKVEMFSRLRYFTCTGRRLDSTPKTIEHREQELLVLHTQLFGPQPPTAITKEALPMLDDSEVIERACSAENGAKFRRLWAGHWEGNYSSQSEADQALCCMLAFWAGRDPHRIDRLFRQSKLLREKWERPDYREGTIQKAIDIQTGKYQAQNSGIVGPRSDPVESVHRQPARESQTTRLLKMFPDIEYVHTTDGRGYVTFLVENHQETHPVRSRNFRTFLQHRFFAETTTALSGKSLIEALGVLEARALYDGITHEVFYRVGESGGNIYIDLGDSEWNAIEISRDGWQVVPRYPVKFRRGRGTLSSPAPRHDPHGAEHFRALLNLRRGSPDDLVLVTAWAQAAMRPRGPFPLLVLGGGHGTGKSTTAKMLRQLLDPNQALTRTLPKDERDLMIAASNSWILSLDNVSHLPDWLSDALCRLSTGAGFSTRELYSDEDEILISATRPAILNGIEEIVTRSDLLERSIILELPIIPESERVSEKQLWQLFREHRPGMLGYLLDIVCSALGKIDNIVLDSHPRMADFAEWSVAGEATAGWREGTFMESYRGNQAVANDLTIEASPIARHLLTLAAPWRGTAAELLIHMEALASDPEKKAKAWPKSPRALSMAIRRISQSLRRKGVDVNFHRDANRERDRLISITERTG